LVALFGESWRKTIWSDEHPCFYRFAAGMLAYEHCPGGIYSDRELRDEFLPAKLDGLSDGSLYWQSPERPESYRQAKSFMAQQEAAQEAFRRAGAPHPTPQ
jgi:hypothetical protein